MFTPRQSLALISSLLLGFSSSCRRANQANIDSPGADAGPLVSAPDAGIQGNPFCIVDNTDPAPDGGLIWKPDSPASVAPAQTEAWTSVSSDPECAVIAPGPVPRELSWTAPSVDSLGNPTSFCWADWARVDGEGDLAASKYPKTWFFRPDGSASALADGNEYQVRLAPKILGGGFLLVTSAFTQSGFFAFAHQLGPDGSVGPAIPTQAASGMTPNPLGGWVERRLIQTCHAPYVGALQVRFVDDALQPLGDWQTVVTWEEGKNNYWLVQVDTQGKALVLSFVYPQSFGGFPPPSQWKLTARWMAADGPIGDAFTPVTPTYTPPQGDASFPGWGMIVPVREGGFALYRDPVPSGAGGTISPTGWYVFYPSGEPPTSSIPGWLHQYDGSLQLLAGGAGYAAVRRDPDTCSRTVDLIAPSGRTCFTLPLEGSDGGCDAREAMSPDGTLLLQNICQHRWWPLLARPAH